MTLPTIEEFNKTIETMREVYPFKDNHTRIRLEEGARSLPEVMVHLYTRDERNDLYIELSKVVESKHPYLDLKKGE